MVAERPADVRRGDPPSRAPAELAASLVDALGALVPDGGRDHALGADRPAAPGAVHARLDVRVPIAVLGNAGRRRWREARFVHVTAMVRAAAVSDGMRSAAAGGNRARAGRRAPSRRRAAERRGGSAARTRSAMSCPASTEMCGGTSIASSARSWWPTQRARASETCSTPGTAAADASIRRIVGSSMPSSTRRSTVRAAETSVKPIATVMSKPDDRVRAGEAGQHADRRRPRPRATSARRSGRAARRRRGPPSRSPAPRGSGRSTPPRSRGTRSRRRRARPRRDRSAPGAAAGRSPRAPANTADAAIIPTIASPATSSARW